MNDLELSSQAASYVLTSIKEEVLTITLNRPEKLNGWTSGMMDAFKAAFAKANDSSNIKAIIFTAKGKYFSAGVNLSGTIKPLHPKKLRELILKHNQQLFETFLCCTKPILVALNGPAIGASVTSATLCNGIIASDQATFSTPFAALGIPPEGCSSVHFERLIGKENAERMLGVEGWKPTAEEAKAVGLIQEVVPQDQLMNEAERIAKSWVDKGVQRSFLGGSELAELMEVNARESANLADAFLSPGFMKNQAQFLWGKKKRGPSLMFFSLWALRPLWGRLM